MLQQQLDRVALVIEQSPRFSPLEAFVWRRLSQFVDAAHFERTGQIIAPVVSPATLAVADEAARQGFTAENVQLGIEALLASGYLVMLQRPKDQDHYRLVLPQTFVAANELDN
jgi:hypothetical protein